MFIFTLFIPLFISISRAATFSLNPSNTTFERTCVRSIAIEIDATGENSNAGEIEINYNPSAITIVDSNPDINGKQIEPGNAYETYFYNDVNEATGTIKLAGASFLTTLNSKKTFAIINFASSQSATTTKLNIKFDGVGATMDSNIADASTSNDLLSGVTNGTYSFINGPCQSDTTAPSVVFQTPTNGATNVSLNSNVVVKINDNQSGVDLNTIIFVINGISYDVNNPAVSYTTNGSEYTFTINPNVDFPADQASTIVLSGKDNAGNSFSSQILFNVPVQEPEPTDNSSPVVNFVNPSNLENNVGPNENIIINISDDGSGVDSSSIILYINGQQFNPGDFGITGDPSFFTIMLNGSGLILEDQVNFIRITGKDLDNNTFDQQIIFNIQTAEECPVIDDDEDPTEDPGDDDNNNDDDDDVDVTDPGISPGFEDLIEQLQNNPNSAENLIPNCFGNEIEFKEVPEVLTGLLGSENPFQDTGLENTFIGSVAKETGVSGFAALLTFLLFSLNAIPLASLILGAPGLGIKLIGIIFGKVSDEPWGVIKDAVTNKPIPFAICQVFVKGSQYKLSQTVSDLEGRYGFILSTGDYRIEVRQSGYKSYSRNITIAEGEASYVYDVDLIPVDKSAEYKTNIFRDVWKSIVRFYKRFSRVLFIFGFLFSVLSIFLSFSVLNVAILVIYGLIILSYVFHLYLKDLNTLQ